MFLMFCAIIEQVVYIMTVWDNSMGSLIFNEDECSRRSRKVAHELVVYHLLLLSA